MLRIARLFDESDSTGAPNYSSRQLIDSNDERARIRQFLTGGTLILRTSGRAPDVLSSENRKVVPISYATDGTWIWSRAAAYYVSNHGIAPEKDFLEHIIRCGYTATTPDEDAINSAIARLNEHFSSRQNSASTER